MTVMDMTSEQLYTLLKAERDKGNLTPITVTRCKSRHCSQIGTYSYRGQTVVIAYPIKFSPGFAAAKGLPRLTPGRAWIADRAPSGEAYGCNHEPVKTTDPKA